ncbi:hypothetical protein AWJ20_5159 [Sugiyamaella lignohabitans]|uniref:Aminotransferase class V domain-containing protein n=1 Tax=Sugiyamaella lignohabitans TaxID=796027 RepID=A0A167EKX9_9ASCO|nr:uncharacterized protein AWJ20_5159 [Sugiyamaella lignohabitans]ANB14198.1 hypothetical protein AWJ20_5159 [Sugiyamaella lignohabitans]
MSFLFGRSTNGSSTQKYKSSQFGPRTAGIHNKSHMSTQSHSGASGLLNRTTGFNSHDTSSSLTEEDDFEIITMEDALPDVETTDQEVPFGRKFGKKYFGFGEKVRNLNHGSFGAIPNAVLDARVRHMKDIQLFPDPFFKTGIFNQIAPIRKQVAELVDADPDNLVFVTNATTAVNTILRSYPFKKGDTFIICNTIYGSCRNTIQFLQDRVGVKVVELTFTYPMNHAEILDLFTSAIDSYENVRMAFFDTVSSMPAATIPWEELCHICRDRGVLSMVDGAHAIGLIPLSLRTARPDFFTSNLHKWLFTPNSVALLYVDRSQHHYVHSLPVSAVYLDDNTTLSGDKEQSRLADTFLYTGTIDYSAILTIPDSIKFRNEVCGGEERIRQYCTDLATRGGALVAKEFGTEILSGKEDNLITSMVTVALPYNPADSPSLQGEINGKYIEYIIREWNTFVPISYYKGQWWSRWSAQVYVDIDDFKYGIRAVLNTLEYLKSLGYK